MSHDPPLCLAEHYWFFIGIGRKLTETTRLEVGFMEQTLQRRGGGIWENIHTVAVWLMSKWPFGRGQQ